MTEVPLEFLLRCRDSVACMRGAGLSDAQIACVVGDIRSASLSEEFWRVQQLLGKNPPHHHRWGDMMDAIRSTTEGKQDD